MGDTIIITLFDIKSFDKFCTNGIYEIQRWTEKFCIWQYCDYKGWKWWYNACYFCVLVDIATNHFHEDNATRLPNVEKLKSNFEPKVLKNNNLNDKVFLHTNIQVPNESYKIKDSDNIALLSYGEQFFYRTRFLIQSILVFTNYRINFYIFTMDEFGNNL